MSTTLAATKNPVEFPLGPPSISGNQITVDTMLNQPTRITRMIADLTLQRFIADRIFASGGGVTGGAVVYDLVEQNELYPDRDVERVAPGVEFPLITSERLAPKVAQVEKWGGKFFYTDEARDRNDVAVFQNQIRKLANTFVRKVNARSIDVLEAAITANAGLSTMVGNDWSAAVPAGSTPTAPAGTPHADFAEVQLLADQRELGQMYDTWIVNPTQLYELRLFYGTQANLNAVLSDHGINDMHASNRVTLGTAYAVAARQVGELRVEQPLATVTEREPFPSKREQTWVQSSTRIVMFVNNPFAVTKVTGL